MSIRPCSRSTRRVRPQRNSALAPLLAFALAAAAPAAHALSSDRDQPMDITADHARITQGTDKAPGITYLTGNVRMTRGTMKATGAQATIYQHPDNARDAQGKDISSQVQRVILLGRQAHMEERNKDGGLVTSNADRIDYNADTSIACTSPGRTSTTRRSHAGGVGRTSSRIGVVTACASTPSSPTAAPSTA